MEDPTLRCIIQGNKYDKVKKSKEMTHSQIKQLNQYNIKIYTRIMKYCQKILTSFLFKQS